jgi:cob(I)alamin adenosyltransferase
MSFKKSGSGDNGCSTLFGTNKKVAKNDPIFEFMGEVDELNSVVGCFINDFNNDNEKDIYDCLDFIQNSLMDLCSHTASMIYWNKYDFDKDKVEKLEEYTKKFDKDLPKLTRFILPRGPIHLARAVARRCERKGVIMLEKDGFSDHGYVFLNRLSDFFFVLARFIEHKEGTKDLIYKFNKKDSKDEEKSKDEDTKNENKNL